MWISTLYKLKIFTPKGLYYFFGSIRLFGFNLMAMIRFYSKITPQAVCLIDEGESKTYAELFDACRLYLDFISNVQVLQKESKVAVVKRNSENLVIVLAGLSCLNKEIVLVNPDIGNKMIATILANANIGCCILDDDIQLVDSAHIKVISEHNNETSNYSKFTKFKKQGQAKLTILTSGTTGVNIPVQRRMNPIKFLKPFFDLIDKLDLLEVKRMFVGVPICHGYGMAAFTMGIVMGKTIVLQRGFEVVKGKEIIESTLSDCLVLVPIMVSRLFNSADGFSNVAKIIVGGAPLTKVVVDSLAELPRIELFNLYGTSEVGVAFCDRVVKDRPIQIGKPLKGVRYKLVNISGGTGELLVKSAWSRNSRLWLTTGDICSVNDCGSLTWKSRQDDMIISGGENVYPITLTDYVKEIGGVAEAYTKVVNDADFGKRLALFVQIQDGVINESEIKDIIKGGLPRYLQPKSILIVNELPYNELGKITKKDAQLLDERIV